MPVTTSELSYPPNTLDPQVNYIFSLTIYLLGEDKLSIVNKATTQCQIITSTSDGPTVFFLPPLKMKSSTRQDLRIIANITSPGKPYNANWNLSQSDINSLNFSSSLHNASRVTIPAFTLNPANTYTFVITVTNSAGSRFAFREVVMNSPPTLGTLDAFPVEGSSLSTIYNLALKQCNDEDLPLTYQFLIYNETQDVAYPLNDISFVNYYENVLYTTNSLNTSAMVEARCYDSFGEPSFLRLAVAVTPISAQEAITYFTWTIKDMNTSLSDFSTDDILQVLS